MTNKKSLIFVVDDEQEILDLYGAALTNAGFEVATALDGQKCIEMTKERKPDLILLDLKMPGMDGVETLVKLREDPQIKDVKVAFLTAFGDPQFAGIDEKFAKETGAIDFIRKGLSLDELIEKVKEYLK